MLCKHCGAQMKQQDEFCPFCGQPVQSRQAQIPASQIPASQIPTSQISTNQVPAKQIQEFAGEVPAAQGTVEPIPAEQAEPASKTEDMTAASKPRKDKGPYKAPRKKKHIGLTIAAIATALVLVAGCLALWWFLREKKESGSTYVMTRQSRYTEDGLQYAVIEYEYNERGDIIRLKSENRAKRVDGEMVYNEITGDFDTIKEFTYDSNGYLTGIISWSNGRASSEHTTYVMDGDQISKIKHIKTAANGKQTETVYLFTYQDGRITEVTRETANGPQPYYQVAYDDEGRVVEEINHEKHNKYEYGYQEDGRILRIKFYGKDYNGKEYSEWIQRYMADYQYDKKGNLTRVEKEDTAGGNDSLELSYDDKYNLLSSIFYEDGVENDVHTYIYEDGKVVRAEQSEYDRKGTLLEKKLIYDKNGNLEEYYDPDGSYTKFEYKELTLSSADADRHRRYNMNTDERSLYGSSYEHYSPFFGYYLIPTPIDPAYGTGPLNR